MSMAGADPARTFLLLELPELLEGGSPPPATLAPVAGAREVITELHRRRRGPSVEAESLADPLGGSRQEFAETARVIDAITGFLTASLFRRAT